MGHLRSNGFVVTTIDVDGAEMNALKERYGVPPELASCHTALIEGYVIEGHVPADLISSLLRERPDIIGLAVPGMPPGSPGMEGPNPAPYDVLAFAEGGESWVYAQR